MNATSRPRETETRWKTPNSARHGSHHEAHLLITIGTCRAAPPGARAAPAGRPERISLACACSAASAGGEPARRARICASVSFDGAADGEEESPSCSRPTTSRTSTAAAGEGDRQALGRHRRKGARSRSLQSRLRVLYPGDTSRAGSLQASGEGRRGAPLFRAASELRFDGGSVSKSTASMAESTSVALAAATIPSSADIARAEKFVRERFLHEGEDAAVALAAGTPRRRALDQALAELARGSQGEEPLDRMAARVLAAAGPRAAALRRGAEAGGRHRALRPPGRRAVGHADGAAGGGAAAQRSRRQRPRRRLSGAARLGRHPRARRGLAAQRQR